MYTIGSLQKHGGGSSLTLFSSCTSRNIESSWCRVRSGSPSSLSVLLLLLPRLLRGLNIWNRDPLREPFRL